MVELTVGYVAGFIALMMFIMQLWSPNTITFILAGVIQEKNTAATWTVAGRALQNSYWPDILRTDSASSYGVRKDVAMLNQLIPFMGTLIAVAGVVTPLGLYDSLVASDKVAGSFKYYKDVSPFGIGTPPRSTLPFSRICSNFIFMEPCPFSSTVIVTSHDDRWYNASWDYYNSSIPDIITDIYSSGTTEPSTVSNFFDIEWRRYTTTVDNDINNGSKYLVGAFRPMVTMVLDNDTEIVEGLIVDSVNGGIGFRNHTIPTGFQNGASWSEDILFVEPETECVNLNLTLDYTLGDSANFTYSSSHTALLTDRGGFIDLTRTYPYYDVAEPWKNADLKGRAYKAAWLSNFITMLYLNITNPKNSTYGSKSFSYLNSRINKTFEWPDISHLDSLQVANNWRDFKAISPYSVGRNSSAGGNFSGNPFRITSDDFDEIGLLCAGAGKGDAANMSSILVACGLMQGVPQRRSAGSPIVVDSGSSWSVPLYSCASAIRATIKTVTFNVNGTSGFEKLTVQRIENKIYQNVDSIPLWGVENTNRNLSTLNPLWGLVSPKWTSIRNVSTAQQEFLYLPGLANKDLVSGFSSPGSQNLPGSDFYRQALESSYSIEGGSSSSSIIDYSGASNMAMWARWLDLSATPESASKIINLVWTDWAASAVVGTKGVLGSFNSLPADQAVSIKVTPMTHQIKYNCLFGIPAFILALMFLLISLLALTSWVSGRSNVAILRSNIHKTSPGRIFTAFLYPEHVDMKTKSNVWSKRVGKCEIDFSEENSLIETVIVKPDDTASVAMTPNTPENERDRFLVPRKPLNVPQLYEPLHGLP